VSGFSVASSTGGGGGGGGGANCGRINGFNNHLIGGRFMCCYLVVVVSYVCSSLDYICHRIIEHLKIN
jgi:hypothetical protein